MKNTATNLTLISPGRSLTTKGHRFSINFFLLDVDIVDIKQMMELGAIRDDELWWSSTYSGKASQPNCIVGEALMVHFSYFTTVNQMLELGLLKEFENIALMELGETLPRTFAQDTVECNGFFLDLCLPKAPACENKINPVRNKFFC